MDDYKTKFEENRKYIKEKHQQINTFVMRKSIYNLASYHHNLNDLESLITKTKEQILQAKQKRNNTTQPTEKKDTDFKAIHDLVAEIKSLKGKYCF